MDTKDEKIINEYDSEEKNGVEINNEQESYDNSEAEFTQKESDRNKRETSIYKKYRQSKNRFVFSCLIFAIFLSLLFTPVFNVKEISVAGNSIITRDAILQKGNLYVGTNILKADIKGAEQKISKIPFILSVSVKRVFPSKIEVSVVECTEVAYIRHIGNYVGVSSLGKILEIVTKPENKSIPVINGIELTEAKIGQNVSLSDGALSNALMQYLSALENNNIISEIKSIDFTDEKDVKLTLSNEILVKMGQADKISYKIAYLEKVFEQLKSQRGGVLDISDPSNSVVYRAS